MKRKTWNKLGRTVSRFLIAVVFIVIISLGVQKLSDLLGDYKFLLIIFAAVVYLMHIYKNID